MKRSVYVVAVTGMLVAVAAPAALGAEERVEGTVLSTTLTACEFKPGTCEGALVLDTKGKDGHVTVEVPKGTQIKKGNDHLFLPGLKGSQVAITYVDDKGARVAKSIEVRPAKP